MELNGRQVDPWGNVLFDKEGLINLLLKGIDLSKDLAAKEDPDIQRFNQLCKEWDHPEDQVDLYHEPEFSVEEWDHALQADWFMPEKYRTMDVLEWLAGKCSTDAQLQRVAEEWALFEEREMIPVLQMLVYLIDDFRERGIVWGVGRGSSVASYVLYLIGVHRIDSMKFDLDVREFLK